MVKKFRKHDALNIKHSAKVDFDFQSLEGEPTCENRVFNPLYKNHPVYIYVE